MRKSTVLSVGLLVCCLLIHGNIRGQEQSQRSSQKFGINYQPKLDDEAKTKIMILGTPHLSELQDCLRPSALEPLLNVVQKFKPDVIGVESVPPAILEDMERRGGYFNEIIEYFAKRRVESGHEMQKLLKISRAEAEDKADALLQSKSALDAGTRLKLIGYLLAAYDYDSAVLQWSYLPENARRQNTMLSSEISAKLNESLSSPDERFSIGLALAKKLGLQKVVGIDDHFDEELLHRVSVQFSKDIENSPEVKAVTQSRFYADSAKQLRAACHNGDEMLRYYLYLNSPGYTSTDVAMQWGVWFRTKLPSGLDRSRVAQWEVRNLNIASRIREATVAYPSKRMLVIIGGGHKPFLDSYLSRMLDVKLVQLNELVKASR